jgi:predicted nucleic acid-binding protein
MAKKNKIVIIDSGVVFDYLKGSEVVRSEIFEKIGINNTFVSTITILETYYGMLKKEEADTRTFFRQINHFVIDKETSQKAIELMMGYRSQKIGLPDCLIAATSIVNNAQLFTYNTKDFDYIEGVKLYKPKQRQLKS